MPDSANANVIRRFHEECLNQGHFEVLPELVSTTVASHSTGAEVHGLAAYEQNLRQARTLFPNCFFTVDDVLTGGDKAAARWTMSATHTTTVAGVPPTGKKLMQQAVVFYRFENGKIAEVWAQMDRISLLRQLGVPLPGVPAPAAN